MPKKKVRAKKLSVLPTLHIFCEGEKTEPCYINGYILQRVLPKYNKRIQVRKTNKNTPVQLVKAARQHKDMNDGTKNDVYWVVFDRESTIKYPDERHLEAKDTASANNINIALSNVCFELWLLLHFEYTTAGYTSCGDLLKRSSLKDHLKEVGISNYDKGYPYLFDKLKDKFDAAVKNAKKLKAHALGAAEPGKESPCYLNPYTDVHKLFESIKDFIEKNPKN